MSQSDAVTPRQEPLAEQFDDLAQQREAAALGMWLFLATEVLLFGGLFTGYAAYRATYPVAFHEASHHTILWIGVTNTAVLLISSLFVALGVHAIKLNNPRTTALCLLVAILLGLTFLGLKTLEYTEDIREHLLPWRDWRFEGSYPSHSQLFWVFYWFMTGLHAIHMIVGISVLSVIAILTRRGHYSAEYYNPVEVSGLYWHFVDIVWIFLLPTFYLVSPEIPHL